MRVLERVVDTTPHTPSLATFSHDRGERRYFLWDSNLALHSFPFFIMLGYEIFYKLALGPPYTIRQQSTVIRQTDLNYHN